MNPRNLLAAALFCILIVAAGCKKEAAPGPPPGTVRINSFILHQADNGFLFGTDTVGAIGTDTIKLVLPGGTRLNSLIPTLTFTGDSLYPASGSAQDFTQPVKYTVFNNGTLPKNYIVVATLTDANQLLINNERVYAVDLATGVARWINESDWTITIFGNAATAGGLVFSGGADGKFYGIDAITGATVWTQQPAHSYFFSAATANGIVYAGCGDGSVYALDAKTGMYKWTTPLNPYGLCSTPLIDNGKVYLQSAGNLYALDANTGNILWTSTTGDHLNYRGSPVINASAAYLSGNDSNVYAIDLSSGNVLWTSNILSVGSTPALVNNTLYVAGTNDSLYALDAATGTKQWQVFVNTGPHSPYISYPGILSGPIVANGTIYIGGGDANFYALDAATGNNLWTTNLGNEANSGAVLINGAIYVGDFDGNIYGINAGNGTIKWTIWTGNSSYALSPAVIASDGAIYNPTR